ncbi:MAG TPA: DUF296 domain-containing protein [Thermoanaerobaculia bacterium]
MKSIEIPRPTTHWLVFDRRDEVLATLRRFAKDQRVRGARFAALGAFSRAVIAYWLPEKRAYEPVEVPEQVEVLSLLGDVAEEDGQVRIHAHAVLGRRGGAAIGGHLIEAIVHPTLEMHLVDYGRPIERRKDGETGLALIDLGTAP